MRRSRNVLKRRKPLRNRTRRVLDKNQRATRELVSEARNKSNLTRFDRNKNENFAAKFAHSENISANIQKARCCARRKSRRRSLFAFGIAGKIRVAFARWSRCSREGC